MGTATSRLVKQSLRDAISDFINEGGKGNKLVLRAEISILKGIYFVYTIFL